MNQFRYVDLSANETGKELAWFKVAPAENDGCSEINLRLCFFISDVYFIYGNIHKNFTLSARELVDFDETCICYIA